MANIGRNNDPRRQPVRLIALARVGCLLASGLATAATAASGDPASSERGRLLYENHCVVCHTAKVHRRIPQLPLSVHELKQIISYWAYGEQLHWSEQDIADVADYLARTYYKDLPR